MSGVGRIVLAGFCLCAFLAGAALRHWGAKRPPAPAAVRLADLDVAKLRLAAIVDSTSDAIVAVSTDGVILDWNSGATGLYGYTPAAALGQRVEMLYAHDMWERERAMLAKVARGASVSQHETVHIRRDGTPIDVALTAAPILDETGHLVGVSAIVRDISERKRIEAQLQYLAERDPLTSLFNRRRFAAELEQELARARRHGHGGAVLAIDLDHFKDVNDSLGHSAGDELIVRTADLLRGRLRATDVLARLGGDEFAAILPDVTPESAIQVANDLAAAVRHELALPGHARPVTASVGVAPFRSGTEITPEELMVEADIAMYDAKEAGRDRARPYADHSVRRLRLTEELDWAERIREALEARRFSLVTQSIASLRHDPNPRHELLLRMRSPDGDLIPPSAFLGAAERFNLMYDIDRWVLSETVKLLGEHQRAGRDLHLQVNMSASTLSDMNVPCVLDELMRKHSVDARGICVEISEATALASVERAQRLAHDLHELGCELALDHFGLGLTTFSYFKRLSFDLLKIDGEFIRTLKLDVADQLMVRAIVDIAHGLGKRAIAEYVEDADTVALLRDYGVDFAQGFYVAHPQELGSADLLALPAL